MALFVPLALLRDPAHVIPAIVQALGLRGQDKRLPLVRLQDALAACTRPGNCFQP